MFKHTSYYTVTRVRFEFRKSQAKTVDNLEGTIVAIIKIEGQKASEPVSTSIRCTKQEWCARCKPKPSIAVQLLIKNLVKWEESIYSAAKTLYDLGEPVTPQNLIHEKNTKGANLVTLEEVYKAYRDYKKTCIGSDNPLKRHVGQISRITYQTCPKRWFYVAKYLFEIKQSKIHAYKVDSAFIQCYGRWMQTQELALPTQTKYIKLLSEILNWGVENGMIKNFQVPKFQGSNAPVAPPYNATDEEVQRIESLVLNDSLLEQVRDGWLLARELCLHFADYNDLKPEHFTLNKDNRAVFQKTRQKQEAGRDIRQIAYVSERALSIWKRYGYKVPIKTSNGRFNIYLKEIGFRAEISTPLKFSHARDSGIFRWVAAGVPDVQTRLAAGWRSMKQLPRYVNFDRRLLDELTVNQVSGFVRPLCAPQGPVLVSDEPVEIHKAS